MTPTQRNQAAAKLIEQFGSYSNHGPVVHHLGNGSGSFVVDQDYVQKSAVHVLTAKNNNDTTTIFGVFRSRLPDKHEVKRDQNGWISLKLIDGFWIVSSCCVSVPGGSPERVYRNSFI